MLTNKNSYHRNITFQFKETPVTQNGARYETTKQKSYNTQLLPAGVEAGFAKVGPINAA